MTIPDRRSRHQADAASCSGPPRWHWRRLPGGGRAAAQGADKPFRIDVHHHLSPPTYVTASNESGFGDPLMKNWTIEKSLADMDKAGIVTAMLSVTTPGINSSKREIEYAFDTLKADGIALMTSYGDKWLGDPLFLPVMEELNRRKALVYTHPTAANCCVNLVPGVPDTIVEFGADTTRTIASLILSGRSQRNRDLNFIFSHGGGVLTAIAERLQIQVVNGPPYKGKFTRESVDAELQRFYYDTAQISNAVTIEALVTLIPLSQIVFGSDFPYRTSLEHVQGLSKIFGGDKLQAIDRENALRILPAWRQG